MTQPRNFSPEVSKASGWNMGLGRGEMKKIHIDKLNDEASKKIASPCPGSYEKSQTFGAGGIHFSMRKKMKRYGTNDGYDDFNLERERKLPGPGYYHHAETIGTRMMSSTFVPSNQSSIPKA